MGGSDIESPDRKPPTLTKAAGTPAKKVTCVRLPSSPVVMQLPEGSSSSSTSLLSLVGSTKGFYGENRLLPIIQACLAKELSAVSTQEYRPSVQAVLSMGKMAGVPLLVVTW